MPRSGDAIRVRIVARDQESERRSERDAFWAPLLETDEFSNLRISQAEAKLCREFGGKLRSALVDQLSEGFRMLDADLFPGSLRDFERLLFRYMEPLPERDAYRYQFAESFTRYLEHRREVLRENAPLRDAQERLAAAASIFFSTRIVGYSSLSLGLSTGSFQQLAKAFDGNFETFRVFLDAFVPVAFAEVFSEEFSDRLEFNVSVPRSVEDAFDVAGRSLEATRAVAISAGDSQSSSSMRSAARERAEWIWRLANGSLLIPLVIALVVMFYGLRLLSEIRSSQYETIQPILQHQLELLKEDRLRMSSSASSDSRRSGQGQDDGEEK